MEDGAIDFALVLELDPGLGELEAAARAVRDPGGELFCANHAWFDIKDALRERLGAWRRPREGETPEAARRLGTPQAFEAAFGALYPLLPPCRACGCRTFEPYRLEDAALRQGARRTLGRASGSGAG